MSRNCSSQEEFRPDRRVIALSALFGGGLCLGVAPVIVKAIELPAEASAFYRVLLAAPIFAAWALVQKRTAAPKLESKRPPFALIFFAVAFFAADLTAMHLSIRMTDVAVATLLTNCAPFFVGLFGMAGFTDVPTSRFWKTLSIALGGILLLVGIPKASFEETGGVLLGLAAAGCYAGYLISVRNLRAYGASPAHIMAWVTAGSTVLIAPIFIYVGAPLPDDLKTWVLVVALTFLGQIAGQGLITVALRSFPVSVASLTLLIQPTVAAVVSWLVLGEVLSLIQLCGAALVLLAIAGMSIDRTPKEISKGRRPSGFNTSASHAYEDCQ